MRASQLCLCHGMELASSKLSAVNQDKVPLHELPLISNTSGICHSISDCVTAVNLNPNVGPR